MTKKTGRPAFQPTAEMRAAVALLAANGIPANRIAATLKNPATGKPIDVKTLGKHFREELDNGFAIVERSVVEALVREAQSGSVSACIFWLKTRAGWKEPQAVELTGAGGGPVAVSTSEANATAEVRAILDQLAAEKAGGFVGLSPAGEG